MSRDELLRILAQSLRGQTPIMIKYHGGTQPGSKRWIVPLMVTDTQLRARDVVTNRAKMFSLAKIEIVDEHDQAKDYAEVGKINNKTPLTEALKDNVGELESFGWRVVLTVDSIDLFDASSAAPIAGMRPNYDTVFTIGVEAPEQRRSDWPWFVFGPRFAEQLVEPEPEPGQAYKLLTMAIRVFLEQARQYAPSKE
jgi:hypothetical protein